MHSASNALRSLLLPSYIVQAIQYTNQIYVVFHQFLQQMKCNACLNLLQNIEILYSLYLLKNVEFKICRILVLHGYQIWFFTVGEEHKLGALEQENS